LYPPDGWAWIKLPSGERRKIAIDFLGGGRNLSNCTMAEVREAIQRRLNSKLRQEQRIADNQEKVKPLMEQNEQIEKAWNSSLYL